MCRICDGFSLDDVLADDAARIAEHGFVLIGVEDPEGPDDHPPWAYTVGLLDAADHPEMIMSGTNCRRTVLCERPSCGRCRSFFLRRASARTTASSRGSTIPPLVSTSAGRARTAPNVVATDGSGARAEEVDEAGTSSRAR